MEFVEERIILQGLSLNQSDAALHVKKYELNYLLLRDCTVSYLEIGFFSKKQKKIYLFFTVNEKVDKSIPGEPKKRSKSWHFFNRRHKFYNTYVLNMLGVTLLNKIIFI